MSAPVKYNSLGQALNKDGQPTDAYSHTVNPAGTPTNSAEQTINPSGIPIDAAGIPLTTAPVNSKTTSSTQNQNTGSSKGSISSLSSSAPTSATATSRPTSTDSGLSTPTIAGIVVGASIGLALITFLLTFLLMRRKRKSKVEVPARNSPAPGLNEKSASAHAYPVSESTTASTSSSPNIVGAYLPQSADDRTVQSKAKTLLDQVELYTENFYQDTTRAGSKVPDSDLDAFNSPYLERSTAAALSLYPRSTPVIKHCLAQSITTAISTTRSSDSTLLPDAFAVLGRPLQRQTGGSSMGADHQQAIATWRILTAYLNQDAASDRNYIASRERNIDRICQAFLAAFAQWANPRHSDEERVRSLMAILKDAASLGVFLVSQGPELQFQFPMQTEVGTQKICVAPALVKLTDERAQVLSKPQILVEAGYERV